MNIPLSLVGVAVKELVQMDWKVNTDRTPSHIALMNEYLRRMALWATETACTKEWPFFDVALRIQPHIRANPLLCEQLDNHLIYHKISHVMRKTLVNHLHWLALHDEGLLPCTQYTIPAPYEPVAVMFKRGGYFWLDSIAICIGIASMFRKPWTAYIDLPAMNDLDDRILDRLDTAFEC
jgi:hypothetical protein